jgi:two-component system, chemotaxis family, CheB/CheR fusion protein
VSNALTLAENQERQRIGRLLHDDLQQILYGVQLQVQLLSMSIGADSHGAAVVETTRRLLDEAIRKTRQLSVDLTPPVLKSEDLCGALAWLVGQMQERHGLRVELDVAEPCDVPDEAARVLIFQSARELLFNVVKHAGVSDAKLSIWRDARAIRMSIEDGGCGFAAVDDRPQVERAGGTGLWGIRHRLELAGGSFEIRSEPGAGVCVSIGVPLSEARPVE